MASINASITSSGLVQTADASGILQLQSDGVTGLTVNANADVTVNTNLFVSGSSVQPLVSGTAQVTTSGTVINFTNIPSWAKRITLMFNGISVSGTSNPLVQIGSGSISSSGYNSVSGWAGGSNQSGGFASTAGFVMAGGSATNVIYGHMIIYVFSGNTYLSAHNFGTIQSTVYFGASGGGSITLSGTLDRIRITTVNGTDTFDAGSINILYE